MQPKVADVHPIISQIIDRDCHVSLSNRAVVRHVVSKLKHGYKTFRAMPKPDRKQLIAECIYQHQNNFKLYREVMHGSFAQPCPTCSNLITADSVEVSGEVFCSLTCARVIYPAS